MPINPLNPKVISGHVLTFWADPSTTKAFATVTNARGEKIINTYTNVTRTTTPAVAGQTEVEFEIDLKRLPLRDPRRRFNTNKQHTYRVALGNANGTALQGDRVEADSTAVDPAPSRIHVLVWIALAGLAIAAALFLWFAPWKSRNSTPPPTGVKSAMEETLGRMQRRMEQMEKAAADKAAADAKIAPPTPTPTPAAAPATPTTVSVGTNSVSTPLAPTAITAKGNGVNLVNTIVNGTVQIGTGPAAIQGGEKNEWFRGRTAPQPVDLLQGQDTNTACLKFEVTIVPQAEWHIMYQEGWYITYEGNFYGIESAFNLRENGSLHWVPAQRVPEGTSNREACWLYNTSGVTRQVVVVYHRLGRP